MEELLLVRGVDEQTLFGRRGRPEQKIELSEEDLEDILSGRTIVELPPVEIPAEKIVRFNSVFADVPYHVESFLG